MAKTEERRWRDEERGTKIKINRRRWWSKNGEIKRESEQMVGRSRQRKTNMKRVGQTNIEGENKRDLGRKWKMELRRDKKREIKIERDKHRDI